MIENIKDKSTGCWLCKCLDYYEKDSFEDSSPEGYYCTKRDVDHFKNFPCNRKLECQELFM